MLYSEQARHRFDSIDSGWSWRRSADDRLPGGLDFNHEARDD